MRNAVSKAGIISR
ncbi:hypothetical protein N6O42_13235 [Escherichia coli]|nr:hypothetical protein [Escherichia coli]